MHPEKKVRKYVDFDFDFDFPGRMVNAHVQGRKEKAHETKKGEGAIPPKAKTLKGERWALAEER